MLPHRHLCVWLCVCAHASTLCCSVFSQRRQFSHADCVFMCVRFTVWVIRSGPYQQQTEDHTEPDPGESHWRGKTVARSLLLSSLSHFPLLFCSLVNHCSFPHGPSHSLSQTCSLPSPLCATVFFSAHALHPLWPYVHFCRHKMHYGSSLSGRWSLTCTCASLSLSGHSGVGVCYSISLNHSSLL